MLKAKLKAALVHASITVVVAMITGIVVFGVWYPSPFAEMTHGTGLFLLVLGVEVVLGPVMSLVIFNTSKPRTELVRDYIIIGMVQLSALCYGLYSVSVSRPVYLVFVKDRIEVVAAAELSADDIDSGPEGFRTLPWSGPRLICVESPTDPQEKSDLLMSALEGRDIQLQPKYYRECRDGEINGKAYSKDQLVSLTDISLDSLPGGLGFKSFTWLPVVTRFGAWTVFYKNGDLSKSVYVDVDPFQQPDAPEQSITPPASTNPPPDNPSSVHQ